MRRGGGSAKRGADELAREARPLLAKLANGGVIERNGAGAFALVGRAGGMPAAAKPRDRGLVEACVGADWLETHGNNTLHLSHAGRASLRRSLAEGDAFREQHQLRRNSEREINGTRRPVLVNEAESPLGWLKSRKDRNGSPLISGPQYEAGERLRADYWFAQMSPRVTANWSALAPSERSRRGAPSSAADLRDEVIAAKERVMRALKEVGPETGGILLDICCELKGLEEAEKANGWPQRAGKVVLQIALTRLARHYGLIARDGQGGRRAGGVRHWGSEDYRPTLDAWRKG